MKADFYKNDENLSKKRIPRLTC